MELYPLSGLLALLLGVRGLRKGSLNTSGAVAATVMGYLCLACPLRVFGVCMIAHYLIGSRATRVKAEVKAQYEDGHIGDGAEGNRSATQVLCNCWLGVLCAVLFRRLYGPAPSGSCSLQLTLLNTQPVSSPALVLTGVAFFAACSGDTLASELGILAKTKPRLITTGREVPPGTNGGVTIWGTLCSALGGLMIGLVAMCTLRINEPPCGLQTSLLLLGTLAGFLGSLIDSILGATVQETHYSSQKKKILLEGHDPEKHLVISGRPLLSNNAVNFVSASVTAVLMGYFASQSPSDLYTSA